MENSLVVLHLYHDVTIQYETLVPILYMLEDRVNSVSGRRTNNFRRKKLTRKADNTQLSTPYTTIHHSKLKEAVSFFDSPPH
jgi:hypothetical protein